MKKSILLKTGIAVFTSALLASMPLRADDRQEPVNAEANNNEVYAGIAIGSTKLTSDFKVTKGSKIDDSDSGYMLFVGRELGNGWAIEGFYADLGEAEWSGKAGDKFALGKTAYVVSEDIKVTASGRTMGVAGKYSWNVHRKTRLYAKLGIHSWKTKLRVSTGAGAGPSDADGVDAMGGIGVEYAISEQLRVIVGSDNYVAEDDDVSLTYVGLRFGFN